MTDAFLSKKNPASAATRRAARLDGILERTLHRTPPGAGPLTKRESEILRFVVQGKTNKQIAQTLCRAERTIEYHRNRLMKKLHAHNAADLVRYAIAGGLI